jgi:hypothetical protein
MPVNIQKVQKLKAKLSDQLSCPEWGNDPMIPDWMVIKAFGPYRKTWVLSSVPLTADMTPKGWIQVSPCTPISKDTSYCNYQVYRTLYGRVGTGVGETYKDNTQPEDLKEMFKKLGIMSYIEMIDPQCGRPAPPKNWDYKIKERRERRKKRRSHSEAVVEKAKKKRDRVEKRERGEARKYTYPPECDTPEKRSRYRRDARKKSKKG